ncbi:polyribonucleotide nucleotidyltransferase [Hydrogenimonas cancrithermarum]|uniref:Polyribonucleotide nucleotidyltransferase n=1 Tax=Hydrogenimonas cancrithermarum TaxID=2993563 RepID=A0ABM8FMD1_9BACT|nr:polyribonucleotide nucleotidyltransferase [Hydrogenimonas cancrithermarum]BDY13525.1 polyribonucleotide nucleotidyltransferase [Hydrogenimonas cancrithermarum]
MACRFEFEMNNRQTVYETGKIARQANGSVVLRSGKTVLLATAVMDDKPVEEHFLPLTVQYIEKSYAAGKIPGGFVKRETKPGDFETLTSRLIDRSLRPLFPKGFYNPVQITVMLLSVDENADLQSLALDAASAALFMSDIPVERCVSGVRIGRKEGEFVLNPSLEELEEGTLDLFVSGTKEDLLMIEMRAIGTVDVEIEPTVAIDPMMDPMLADEIVQIPHVNELKEEELVEAIALAKQAITLAAGEYERVFAEAAKPKKAVELFEERADPSIVTYIKEFYMEEINRALDGMAKSERGGEIKALVAKVLEDETAQAEGWSEDQIKAAVGEVKRERVRAMILEEGKRADGRGLRDVRPISIETNLLPSVHGSCLFTRGETQALVTCTLGNRQDAQMFERITGKSASYEEFMVHYNFPGFSVGEASRIGPPGRRELGHGNLAKRALEPALDKTQLDMIIRLVSEILESNGSSSMATVCGGSLALKAADVPVLKLIAGVAMGLVTENDKYAILTDIMGLEDHDGDMDFKVAGSEDGITALQMDIKLGGVSLDLLKEALDQAKEARLHILGIMEEAAKKIEVNEEVLPSTEIFHIEPHKIVDIIGQAGKTIREIIEKFEVNIDLDKKQGEVKVTGPSKAKVKAACDHIRSIAEGSAKKELPQFEIDKPIKGKVKKIVDFGAFVELPGGVDGLLHISKISRGRIGHPSDLLHEGQEIEVVVKSQKGHKIELALSKPID